MFFFVNLAQYFFASHVIEDKTQYDRFGHTFNILAITAFVLGLGSFLLGIWGASEVSANMQATPDTVPKKREQRH